MWWFPHTLSVPLCVRASSPAPRLALRVPNRQTLDSAVRNWPSLEEPRLPTFASATSRIR